MSPRSWFGFNADRGPRSRVDIGLDPNAATVQRIAETEPKVVLKCRGARQRTSDYTRSIRRLRTADLSYFPSCTLGYREKFTAGCNARRRLVSGTVLKPFVGESGVLLKRRLYLSVNASDLVGVCEVLSPGPRFYGRIPAIQSRHDGISHVAKT